MEERLQSYINSVLSGNKAQYRFIVREFEKRIFYYFLRMTRDYEEAKDLTQNTFVRAYSYLKSYKQEYSFSSWLFSIAHNQMRDWWASRKKSSYSIEEMEERYFVKFASDESVEGQIEEKNLKERVKKAILSLPDLYRDIMLLLIVEEQSYEEIARITELPVNTVKIRIHRARKLLKKTLEKWI